MLEVSRNRQWVSKGMHEEIKEWLSMLLAPVDITSEKAESYLKDFLTTKMGGVTKLYSEHIKRDVSGVGSTRQLKMECFVHVVFKELWSKVIIQSVC